MGTPDLTNIIILKVLFSAEKVLSFGPNQTVEVWPNRTFGRSLAWRDFKINVFRPLFTTIIFRPKMVLFDTDSILRVKPMYESVK